MRSGTLSVVRRLARVLSLALFAALGSTVLLRYAPGYFVDARELDGAHATEVRSELATLQAEQGSLPHLLGSQLRSWFHGDLGLSRHYNVPVSDLLRQRSPVTGRLLAGGLLSGWLLAAALALPLSARRTAGGETLIASATAMLLAIPVGVLATISLLLNRGGPALVLSLLIAVRDFKLLYRLFRGSWSAPSLLHARAQGFSPAHMIRAHLLPSLAPELLAVAMMSFVVALSALVPVEVIFDLPGLGQLAWSAATNRDLPVLVDITILLAGCVGVASLFVPGAHRAEITECA